MNRAESIVVGGLEVECVSYRGLCFPLQSKGCT